MKKIHFIFLTLISSLALVTTGAFITYYFVTKNNDVETFSTSQIDSKIENNNSQIITNKNQIELNVQDISSNKHLILTNQKEIANNKNQIKNNNTKTIANEQKIENLNTKVGDFYTKSIVDEKIKLEIEKNKGSISTSADKDKNEPIVVYTKTETNNLIDAKNNVLKTETNNLIDAKNNVLKTEIQNQLSSLEIKNTNTQNALNTKANLSNVYTKDQIDSKKLQIRYLESQFQDISNKIANNKEILIQNPTSFLKGDRISSKDTVVRSFLQISVDSVDYLIEWKGFITGKNLLTKQVTQMHYASGQNSKMGSIKAIHDSLGNIKIVFNGASLYNSSEWTPTKLEYKFIVQVASTS